MTQPKPAEQPIKSRRDFLRGSTAAIVGGTLIGGLGIARSAHAAGDDMIKIALVGCGGRGTGAASQALQTGPGVKLVAMADAFPDQLESSLANLKKDEALSDKIDVPAERRFVGFKAYQQAIDAGVDMVILATPPGFRPIHFAAAVAAGKHVFMEKPVAVDGPGVRKVLAAAEEAKQKKLGVGVGFQRRHQSGYLETLSRLENKEIGDIHTLRIYWNGAKPWVRTRAELQRKKGAAELTEMEYQMRNWYYFNWLCGDHIVEQHIHNLDVGAWMKGAYPVKANGMGGCEVRKGKDYGEIFDHHFVEYEFADGARMFSQCRHIENCFNSVSEHAQGTKGTCDTDGGGNAYVIRSADGQEWRRRGQNPNPYQVEHNDLIASIRSGSPINEAERGAKSTLTAILGRLATYSGKEVTWDDALDKSPSLSPAEYDWNATPPVVPGPDGTYARAIPGITRVVG